jgi:hypothetical protein
MADVAATNHSDVAIVGKRDHGRPRGSKNKLKSPFAAAASSSTLAKRCPSRPLGSKNKKSSVATMDPAACLDVSVVHLTLSASSSSNLFALFSFVGAQCREQQCLPLKFTKFMESDELREAVL